MWARATGCVVTLADGGLARVCRDGPVFAGEEVFGSGEDAACGPGREGVVTPARPPEPPPTSRSAWVRCVWSIPLINASGTMEIFELAEVARRRGSW